MLRFGRRARMTPVVPVAEGLPRRNRWWQLPGLGGHFVRRRQRHAALIPDAAMPPPADVFPDMEGNEETDFFMMPERPEDWPNFILESTFRPIPFPEHVAGNDRNNTMNMIKQMLFRLTPAGLPGQPQDAAAPDAAADESLAAEPGTVRRSASARIHRAEAPQIAMVRIGGQEATHSSRFDRAACRRGTR